MSNSGSNLKADLEKYYRIECKTSKLSFLRKLRLFIVHFGLHCVLVYRFGEFARRISQKNWLVGLPLKIIFYIVNYFIRLIHHVEIHSTNIGPGLYISHVGTILIGPITIGCNLSITHNVTIGIGHRFGEAGMPSSIGDNVWIGTGSVISGDISIGKNVTIGSGCILSRSLPDGCLAMGNPGRIVELEYDNRYLFCIEENDNELKQ